MGIGIVVIYLKFDMENDIFESEFILNVGSFIDGLVRSNWEVVEFGCRINCIKEIVECFIKFIF